MDPAPTLRGLLQMPPPSRRCTLSPSLGSACCHRRAEPGRRASPGLDVCSPETPGPPPRRGRPFSTVDSVQPARSEGSPVKRKEPCARSARQAAGAWQGRGATRLRSSSLVPNRPAGTPPSPEPRSKSEGRHAKTLAGPRSGFLQPRAEQGLALSSRPAG